MTSKIFRNNNVCDPKQDPEIDKCSSPTDSASPDWLNTTEPFYDEQKRKYFVKQTFYGDQKIIRAVDFLRSANKLPDIEAAGVSRIKIFFNARMPINAVVNSKIEDYNIPSKGGMPVDFLVSVPRESLNLKKSVNVLQSFLETEEQELASSISYSGDTFNELLDKSINMSKSFSKYQSYMHTFDKVALIRTEDDTPFYFKFLAKRLENFKTDFNKLLDLNDFPLEGPFKLEEIKLFFDNNEELKLNGVSCKHGCGIEYKLKTGVKEFTDKPFLKDLEVLNTLINLEQFTTEKAIKKPWLDLTLANLPTLGLRNLAQDKKSSTDCFANFDSLVDYVLDDELSFIDKLEYAFQKKNSTKLINFLDTIPKVIDANKSGTLEDQLTEVFTKSRDELIKQQRFIPDDLLNDIIELLERYASGEGDFEDLLEYFSPTVFRDLAKTLIQKIPNLLNFDEMQELIFDKSFDYLSTGDVQGLLGELSNDLIEKYGGFLSNISFPWTPPAVETDVKWFNELLGDLNKILESLKLPDLRDIDISSFAYLDQISVYEIIKINFPDIQFPFIDSTVLRDFEMPDIISVTTIQDFYNFIQSKNIIDFPTGSLSFSTVTIPEMKIPSFNFESLKVIDLKELIEFSRVFVANISLPSIDFSSMDDSAELNTEQKKSFFKIFYDSIISNIASLKIRFDELYKKPFDFTQISAIDISSELEDLKKSLSLGSVKSFLGDSMNRLEMSEFLNKIPDLNLLGDLVSSISIPTMKLDKASTFLSSLNINLDVFEIKSLRLPSIPEIPSINFNIVEVIKQQFMNVLLEVVKKLIVSIIAKLVNSLKSSILELTSPDAPVSTDTEYNSSDGWGQFVQQYMCDENPEDLSIFTEQLKDPAALDETSAAAAKEMIGNPSLALEECSKLSETLSSMSSISDIINAVVEDDSKVNSAFIDNTTKVIQSTLPNLRRYFKDADDTRLFFKRGRNFLTPEIINQLKDFRNNLSPEIDVDASICLTKDQQQQWKDDRQRFWENLGDGRVSPKDIVDMEIEKAKKSAGDLIDIAVGMTPSNIQDLFSGLAEAADKEINKDKECEDKTTEVEREQARKQQAVQNQALEKINLTFMEDLVEPSILPGKQSKGILSRILADKYGRNMSLCTFLKTNFITKLLIQVGVIPNTAFADTIGKQITDNFSTNFSQQYTTINTSRTISGGNGSLFFNFIPNILSSEPDLLIKEADFTMTAQNGTDISYIDHVDYGLDYKVYSEETKELYSSKIVYDEEILNAFPSIDPNNNENRAALLSRVISGNSLNSQAVYESLNSAAFNMFESLGYGEQIGFGYPEEVTKDDIDTVLDAYRQDIATSSKEISSLADKDFRIDVLDPEIYGGLPFFPKIYINTEGIPEGFFKDSFNFYDQDVENKLNKTILFSGDVENSIKETKNKLKTPECIKAPPNIIRENMFQKVGTPETTANREGAIKLYIRSHIAELILLANPVIKATGFVFDDLMIDYIMKKMKSTKFNKKIGKPNLYGDYVYYLTLLESNAQMYMRDNEDDMSSQLSNLSNSFVQLDNDEIQEIKDSTLLLENVKYNQYIKGFHVLSFGDKAESVYEANSLSLNSAKFTDAEVKFANKLGFLHDNIDFLEEVFAKSIKKELDEYGEKYPSQKNIYKTFISSLTGQSEELLFSDYIGVDQIAGWSTKRYYVLQTKDGQIGKYSLKQMKEILATQPEFAYISDLFGNAVSEGKHYSGTIGIQSGIGLFYNEVEIVSFTQDIKDQTVKKTLLEGLGADDVDVDCYISEMVKTPQGKLLFDYCVQIKKIPSISAIYYMENFESSIGQDTSERESSIPNPFGGVLNLITNTFSQKTNFLDTKDEIRDFFFSNYVREFHDPEYGQDFTFFDFKSKEKITNNIDMKNLATGFASAPSISQLIRITDNIELDEDGNPLVNKFLSTFKD